MASLDIELKDSSTQVFTTSGEPVTSHSDSADPELTRLAEEVAEALQRVVIESQAARPSDVLTPEEIAAYEAQNDPLDVFDPNSDTGSNPGGQPPSQPPPSQPPLNQQPTSPNPAPSQPSSGQQPPNPSPGQSPGPGGLPQPPGVPPTQPGPNQPPPGTPPTTPNPTQPPPGGGGAVPPGGLPNPGGQSFVGLGMMFGPIGIAVGGVVDIVDNLIMAFAGLEQIVLAVDDAMESIVEDTRGFSGDVAVVAALRDVTNILIKLDRAQQIGPDVAKWLETRTDIDFVMGKMATDISEKLLPYVQQGTEAILDVLILFREAGPIYAEWFDRLMQALPFLIGPIGMSLVDQLAVVHANLEVDREMLRLERKRLANSTVQGFKDFFDQHAAPLQGFGGQPAPGAVIGGFGG